MFRQRQGLMEAGLRDRRVTIEYRDGLKDSDSDGTDDAFPVDDWPVADREHVWMSREAVKASERFTSDQLSARQEVRWEMAYRPDMDPDLVDVPRERRLVYEGRTLDIVAADLVGRREGISLTTLAKVG